MEPRHAHNVHLLLLYDCTYCSCYIIVRIFMVILLYMLFLLYYCTYCSCFAHNIHHDAGPPCPTAAPVRAPTLSWG
jgi:hypothetical protein